jgi:hypothetical protein
MKKILTLVCALGLITAIYAQDGRHSDRNQGNGYQQPQTNHSDRNQGYGYQQQIDPSQNNYGHQNGYRGQDMRGGRDNRNFESNDRRNMGYNNRFDENSGRSFGYNNQNDRRMQNRFPVQRRKSIFQIVIGGGNGRNW